MAKILIVDDNVQVGQLLLDAFQGLGHQFFLCPDGATALSVVLSEAPGVVLSDVEVPVMSGLALAKAIQGQRPGLPVVLMSGGAPDMAEAAARVGAVASFVKPFQLLQIMTTVSRLVEEGGDPAARLEGGQPGELPPPELH